MEENIKTNGSPTLANEAISIIRKKLDEYPDFDGRAVLLFSGGRDSSTVAAAFCQAFPKSQLHLLFIDNGLLSRKSNTMRQYELIKSLYPDTEIIFETKRVSQIMRVAAMQEIEKDFKIHNFSTLLVCVACKLIMAYAASTYVKEIGVKFVLDGFADRQRDYPEQTEIFIKTIKNFFIINDLIYLSPLYYFLNDKDKTIQTLKELGVYIGKQEPICMFSDSFSIAKEEEIKPYIEKTIEIIKKFDPILHI